MSKRREFLRNIALAIAAALLPRILQPISSISDEIENAYEKMRRFKIWDPPKGYWIDFDNGQEVMRMRQWGFENNLPIFAIMIKNVLHLQQLRQPRIGLRSAVRMLD